LIAIRARWQALHAFVKACLKARVLLWPRSAAICRFKTKGGPNEEMDDGGFGRDVGTLSRCGLRPGLRSRGRRGHGRFDRCRPVDWRRRTSGSGRFTGIAAGRCGYRRGGGERAPQPVGYRHGRHWRCRWWSKHRRNRRREHRQRGRGKQHRCSWHEQHGCRCGRHRYDRRRYPQSQACGARGKRLSAARMLEGAQHSRGGVLRSTMQCARFAGTRHKPHSSMSRLNSTPGCDRRVTWSL
jgi:hypothetical protein